MEKESEAYKTIGEVAKIVGLINKKNVVLVEKSNELGGLARSVKYKDGFIEKFYHYYGQYLNLFYEL